MGRSSKRNKTRKFTRTLLTGAALFLSHTKTAYAGIDVKDASFSTRFVDLDTGHVAFSRTYDSRSTFNGLFGFGWCSDLDRTLVKAPHVSGRQATTSIAIDVCGRRTLFAAVGAPPTRRWVAKDAKDGYVDLDRGSFTHHASDGRWVARFDGGDGGLRALASRRGEPVQILREPRGSLLRDAAPGEGSRVRLEVDPLANKILRIEAPDGRRATFEYDGEDLAKVTNAWNNTYLFRYDSLHNLVESRYPDATTERLTYDADRDVLTSFQGRNGCVERYEIALSSPHRNRSRQKTLAVKTCGEKEISRVGFEFDYRRTPTGWRLSKLKLTRADGRMSLIDYDKGGSK